MILPVSFTILTKITINLVRESEKPNMNLDNALTTNFLYGRNGPINRPISSLAGGTHGPVNPIGFYYEDDDEYESKSIFVGGANDTREEPEAENNREISLQREIQERLRHIQHHAYRPSGNESAKDN